MNVVAVEMLERNLLRRLTPLLERRGREPGRDHAPTRLASELHGALADATDVSDAHGQSVLLRHEAGDALSPALAGRVVERVARLFQERRHRVSDETIDTLVAMLLPPDFMASVRRDIEVDNARLRADFLQRFPCLTSRDLAKLAGHAARNASMTATRWKQKRRIFAVAHAGQDLFPAFQFRDGAPHPSVTRVLDALPSDMTAWQTALWFSAGNGWLGGDTPASRLDDAEAVAAAAAREAEPIAG